jgi:hypothetical protein
VTFFVWLGLHLSSTWVPLGTIAPRYSYGQPLTSRCHQLQGRTCLHGRRPGRQHYLGDLLSPPGATLQHDRCVHLTLPFLSETSIAHVPVLLNNYFGRQFNSLNDVAVSPRTKELYFTDVTYGYLQDFRPTPGFPNQVYRFNEKTGLVSIAADGFNKPNGALPDILCQAFAVC